MQINIANKPPSFITIKRSSKFTCMVSFYGFSATIHPLISIEANKSFNAISKAPPLDAIVFIAFMAAATAPFTVATSTTCKAHSIACGYKIVLHHHSLKIPIKTNVFQKTFLYLHFLSDVMHICFSYQALLLIDYWYSRLLSKQYSRIDIDPTISEDEAAFICWEINQLGWFEQFLFAFSAFTVWI